jgi:hypothetical protein
MAKAAEIDGLGCGEVAARQQCPSAPSDARLRVFQNIPQPKPFRMVYRM